MTHSPLHRTLSTGLYGLMLFLLLIGSAEAGSALKAGRQAAEALVKDMNGRSGQVFSKMLDFDSIVDAALLGVNFSAKDRADFKAGMEQARDDVGGKIVGQMAETGYAKLLRVKQDGKLTKALIRLDYGDLGYGYMDLHLKRRNKQVRIVDWYDYSLGQTYTSSLNQLIAMVAPNPTLIGRIFDVATDRSKDMKYLQKFMKVLNNKGYKAAKKVHRKLSDDIANSRMVSLMLVQAASASDNDEWYRDALAHLATHHSKDPSLAFILIDHYFYTQDYDRVVAIIDSLMKEFGVQDAAQLSMKASVMVEKGDYNNAVRIARKARKQEPELEATYWTLLSANIGAKNYRDAVKAGDTLEKKFHYTINAATLAEDDYFQGFLSSKEFKAWDRGKTR